MVKDLAHIRSRSMHHHLFAGLEKLASLNQLGQAATVQKGEVGKVNNQRIRIFFHRGAQCIAQDWRAGHIQFAAQ
jgi:hypothetical protein